MSKSIYNCPTCSEPLNLSWSVTVNDNDPDANDLVFNELMFNESEIFTVADVAEKLKCSIDNANRLIKSGEIGSITVKSAVRVCGWQLNEWIAGRSRIV